MVSFFILLGLYYSKIKVNFKYINIAEDRVGFEIDAVLYLFGKIKFLKFIFSPNGIKFGKFVIPYKKILKKTINRINLKKIKGLNLQLEEADFDILIGQEEVFINIVLVTLISSISSFALKNKKSRFSVKSNFEKNVFELKGKIVVSFKTRKLGIFLNTKEHTKDKILVGG